MGEDQDELRIENLVVRYGGVTAVDHVTLAVPRQMITGLIGPNGAGKTTTFNACSGLLAPTAGSIVLDGADVSGLSAQRRAQLGLGRTFQRMQLFESTSVAENVRLGREARLSGRNPLRHVYTSRAESAALHEATEAALHLCGIADIAHRPVVDLSTGQRRLVELARAVAGDFRFLLLDEPSSGLDVHETKRFGEVLRQLSNQQGVGILLVEHDMNLVMSVCEYIYVIDFGRPIYDGPPADVQRSDVVRAAYLGDGAAA